MSDPRRRPRQNPSLLGRARRMRQEMTDAEALLWSRLRGRAVAGRKFRRQFPVEPYIVDFYCESARLAVELDGRQHGEEAHVAYDERRTSELARRGIRMLRFANEDVLRDVNWVLERIEEALADDG